MKTVTGQAAPRPAVVLRSVMVVLTVAMALTGCGGDSGIELIENGSKPREELRLQVAAGYAFGTVMTMKMGVTTSLDGQEKSQTLPDTKVTMEGTVERVADNGDITFSYEYSSVEPVATAGIDEKTLANAELAYSQLEGVTGTAVASARGELVKSSIETQSVKMDELRETLDSLDSQMKALAVPFPDEAVGVGATWKAVHRAKRAGVDTEMTLRYRLAELDGNRYKLDVQQHVTAPRGPAEIPGLKSARIDEYEVNAQGSIEGRTDRILPMRSLLEGTGDVRMNVTTADGKGANAVQHIDMRILQEEPTG